MRERDLIRNKKKNALIKEEEPKKREGNGGLFLI